MAAADLALTVVEPQLITLSGPGWDGVRAWAYPRPKTSPDRIPANALTAPQVGAGAFTLVNGRSGFVAKASAGAYRAWSEASPWVRAAIDILRDAVATAEWDILPVDKSGRKNVRLAKRIRDLFENPNPGDTFWTWVQKIVEDIAVLDAGVFEKVRYPTGEIAELWPTAGEYIWVSSVWDGSDPDETRYLWVPDGTVRARFTNDEMVYIMQNPRTNSTVGLSPLEVLRRTIEAELYSMDYNSAMVRGAPPEGVLNLGESALPEDVQRARTYWESEILGQSALAIIGGYKSPGFIKFRDNNQEMQFREWLDYLVRQTAVVYGLSPMDLGLTFDVNRSTAEQQGENTEGRGMKPLMGGLQQMFTRYVVQDESFGGRENNLQFAFTSLNLKESKSRADINKIAMGGSPWKTVNEARLMEGRPPLGELDDEDNIFNHILAVTPKGLMDISTGQYVGEAELAKVQAEARISVVEAQAEARAANPDAVQPADVGGTGVGMDNRPDQPPKPTDD